MFYSETSYELGLNVTNVKWTDDLYNTSSKAYQELLAKFLEEVYSPFNIGTINVFNPEIISSELTCLKGFHSQYKINYG